MSKRRVTKYTEEFKQSSAKLAFDSDQPTSKTAKELGINYVTLSGWVKKYHPDRIEITKLATTNLESEVKKLKKELNRVTQERDILKKAAAYFAGEMQ